MLVNEKPRAFPTLIVVINFKLSETHLPAFTIFYALTDGFPRVCKFHLAMSAQLIQAIE